MKTLTETLQDIATNASTTRDRAIVRACFVQGEIDRLRGRLDLSHLRQFRDVGDTYEDVPNAALLASYDRELTRLCAIPGVLSALLAEMVIEETTP